MKEIVGKPERCDFYLFGVGEIWKERQRIKQVNTQI
jgi:hypothetical protein